MARARYRSKLEVFRDLLVATRHASKKTRIIGLANLNPSTFQRHMAIARAQGLVTVAAGGFQLTQKADQVLAALQELMAKSNELDNTIQFLERSGLPPAGTRWSDGTVLRQVSRLAWGETGGPSPSTGSAFARSGGVATKSPGEYGPSGGIEELLSTIATRRGHSARLATPHRALGDEALPPDVDVRSPTFRRPRA